MPRGAQYPCYRRSPRGGCLYERQLLSDARYDACSRFVGDRTQDVNSCMQVCSVISERIWYRLRVFMICEDISQANKAGTCCPVPTAWRSSSRHQLPTGFEPATRCLQNSRSSQLSYRSTFGRSGSPDKICKSPYYQLSAIRIFCQHKSATYSVQNG